MPRSNATHSARHPPAHMAVGRIIRPHGIRGKLVVQAYGEVLEHISPGFDVFLGENLSSEVVETLSVHKKRFLLRLKGIENRNQAETLRDEEIFIRLADIPPLQEDEYYAWQLLGLSIVTEEGELLGELTEILKTGANDVFVVHDEAGDELLLPATDEVIRKIEIEKGQILVHLLPGLRR